MRNKYENGNDILPQERKTLEISCYDNSFQLTNIIKKHLIYFTNTNEIAFVLWDEKGERE